MPWVVASQWQCNINVRIQPDGYLVEIEQTGAGSTEPAESQGSGFAGAEAGSA